MSFAKDFIIQDQIDDTIQCMKFIPTQNVNYLATGGWDSRLRVYNINYNVINTGKEIQVGFLQDVQTVP